MSPPRTRISHPNLYWWDWSVLCIPRNFVRTYQSELVLVQALSCPLEYKPESALQTENANRCSAFKNDRLVTRLLTICKRTNSLSTFVFVREKKLIKALVPKGFEKPFTITSCQACASPISQDGITHMYGPGRPLSALKQRAVSSMSTGPPTFRIIFSLVALPFAIVTAA